MGINQFVLSVLFGLNLFSSAADRPFTAKIFDLESGKQKVLFTYQSTMEHKGDTRIATTTYTAPDGSVAEIEIGEYAKDGDHEKLTTYRVSQKQLGAEGSIEVRDGKVNFTYTVDGKTKTATEKLTDNFVIGPTVVSYLTAHWEQILKGEKVGTRFGVPDRLETVGFDFFKEGDDIINGKKVIAVKMKPTSFLIAALVKPLIFCITPDDHTLLEVRGRVQVKQKVDGKFKDLDAVTTFSYDGDGAVSSTEAGGNSK